MDIRTIWYTKIYPWMKKYWVIAVNSAVIAVSAGLLFGKVNSNAVAWLLLSWLAVSVVVGASNKLNPQPEPPIQ